MLGLLKKKKECQTVPNGDFFMRDVNVHCAIIAIVYTHLIGNQLYNTMVVFKKQDSVGYSNVCNVLCLGESCSSILIESKASMIHILLV